MWINGIKTVNLSAFDRAVQFGDGCFTTAAVLNGKVIFLKNHLKRLKENCQRLFINLPNFMLLESEICYAAIGYKKAVLKVILTSGIGERGYSRTKQNKPTRIILLSPWPNHYEILKGKGVILITSPIELARNPLLAGMKHLNRLEQVLIRRHCDYNGGDEALVLDTKGKIISCCAANIFWRKGNDIYTPNLKYAGVNGIMRCYLIDQIIATGQNCHIVEMSKKEVINADEITICNSLMPVLPVRQIDNILFIKSFLFNQLNKFCQNMTK
ncbi:aminodeoxychorismate lyase [Pantoea sp. Aalb]|uniref:aminodeoxychorismate lyase n=1 Tax=Pantoea sp. Aalb TaxID=2576762 RepID=UPI0013274B95|nr:aminodeoxychorismate lyase [Pantoea sp. Aalb]MXP67461.1 aminodeoxychorismate lyase [Pantoea sp. Aalb]